MQMLTLVDFQANPKLAKTKDDDDRLPIHWAVAYNRLPVVELLVSQKNFDPDVEVAISLNMITNLKLGRILTVLTGWIRLDSAYDCS